MDAFARAEINARLIAAGFPPVSAASLKARIAVERIEAVLFAGQDNYVNSWSPAFVERMACMLDEVMG